MKCSPANVALLSATLVLSLPLSAAHGHSIWIKSVTRDCAIAIDDTVEIEVMLNNTVSPIAGGAFNVSVQDLGSVLTFVSARRGDLIQSWENFSVPSTWPYLQLSLSGSTPIPAGTSGQLARLKFVANCCSAPSLPPHAIWPWGGEGDFAFPGMVTGYFQCVLSGPGFLSVGSGFAECDGAPDTIAVDVRFTETEGIVQQGGVDLVLNSEAQDLLSFIGWERGALVANWESFNVTVENSGDILHVTGTGTQSPLPAGTAGVFIRLFYQANCCAGGQWGGIYALNLSGDLASYNTKFGYWNCVRVATKPTTWGYIKSMYR